MRGLAIGCGATKTNVVEFCHHFALANFAEEEMYNFAKFSRKDTANFSVREIKKISGAWVKFRPLEPNHWCLGDNMLITKLHPTNIYSNFFTGFNYRFLLALRFGRKPK